MTSLPHVSGRQCVAALLKKGFQFKRQNGIHIILRLDEPFAQVVVPDQIA
jgi:predicted RNA binding protein YcfA (HicA-like mRNA interferase family)